jgi:transposase
MIEVALPNGRLLRVSEAIRPEVLGRLAAALDA